MKVRSSTLRDFRMCPRRYYYRYCRGLVQREEHIDLAFGHRLHEAIARFHAFGLDYAMSHVESWDEFPNCSRHKNMATMRALLNAYVKLPQPTKVVGIEHSAVASVGRYELAVRFDLVAEYNGMLWIVDHKTSSPRFLLGKPNDQFFMYYYVARKVGLNVAGVVVNSLDPRQLKVERYFYQIDPDDLEEWLEELKLTLEYYELCTRRGQFPRHAPDACFLFNRECDYLQLCKANSALRSRMERLYEVSDLLLRKEY